jgi:hypothetical protein
MKEYLLCFLFVFRQDIEDVMSRLKPWRAEDDSIIFQVEKGEAETKKPFSIFAKFSFLENLNFPRKSFITENRPNILFLKNRPNISDPRKPQNPFLCSRNFPQT